MLDIVYVLSGVLYYTSWRCHAH